MKTRFLGLVAAALLCTPLAALAQEHFTQGPVWEVSFYRVKDGQWDNYMTYLRTNGAKVNAEAKKQGLILDWKIMSKAPTGANDWDVAVATLHANGAKALDYDKADEEKFDAIQSAHWKTGDQDKQREMSAKRFDMRTYLGTQYWRELNLRPMN